MMQILSFDKNYKIQRDPNQGNLFNFFEKNIVYKNMPVKPYLVPKEFEMRMDKISNYIYGSPNFVEELMLLNDIINPYSIQEGQTIWYCSMNNLQNLYNKDNTINDDTTRQTLINSSQPNRNKKKLKTTDQGLPPTIKPDGLQQIKVSKDNKVEIINSFQ